MVFCGGPLGGVARALGTCELRYDWQPYAFGVQYSSGLEKTRIRSAHSSLTHC